MPSKRSRQWHRRKLVAEAASRLRGDAGVLPEETERRMLEQAAKDWNIWREPGETDDSLRARLRAALEMGFT